MKAALSTLEGIYGEQPKPVQGQPVQGQAVFQQQGPPAGFEELKKIGLNGCLSEAGCSRARQEQKDDSIAEQPAEKADEIKRRGFSVKELNSISLL